MEYIHSLQKIIVWLKPEYFGVEMAERCVFSVYSPKYLPDLVPIVPYLVSLEELPLSIIMGETAITNKATNIKLHTQRSMERKARKVHFSKFGSMRFQKQCRRSQERRIDYEM